MPSSHSTLAHYLTEAKQANLNIQADFDQKSATLDLKKKGKQNSEAWGMKNRYKRAKRHCLMLKRGFLE